MSYGHLSPVLSFSGSDICSSWFTMHTLEYDGQWRNCMPAATPVCVFLNICHSRSVSVLPGHFLLFISWFFSTKYLSRVKGELESSKNLEID